MKILINGHASAQPENLTVSELLAALQLQRNQRRAALFFGRRAAEEFEHVGSL